MRFFRQGKIETRYGLNFRSTFGTLEIDRPFRAGPRERARAACGEKIRRSAIVLEAGFTKNGMFAEIGKTVVSSAPAAARSAAPADIETEMAEEEGSEMASPVRASPNDRQPYSA
jgi:hypothetical protein